MGNPDKKDNDEQLTIAEQAVSALAEQVRRSSAIINAKNEQIISLIGLNTRLIQVNEDLGQAVNSLIETNEAQAHQIDALQSVLASNTVTNTVRLSQPTDSDKKTAPTRRNSI